MTVLVTGGAGFIGSHLCEALLARGDRVIALDDFSTGRRENLETVRHHDRFELVRASVENEQIVGQLMGRCDRVYHLASAVGVQLIVDEPVRTIRTIIRGTEVVMEAAHRFGRPVLITSTSEVYGKGSRVPFAENDDVVMGPTTQSRWCYAYAKGIDEFLGLAYHKQFGLPVTIVRLFNTVGPRQIGMYGMVLPRFVTAALAGEPLKVYGDGTQTRCFCHVSDVTLAMVKLMHHDTAAGQVFNLGHTREISMNELASEVRRCCNSNSPIEHMSYEEAYGQKFDDMPRRVPDLAKIQTAIGYAPQKSLEEIIQSVIESQKAA